MYLQFTAEDTLDCLTCLYYVSSKYGLIYNKLFDGV
jgi:hypothetical protein